MNGTTWTQGLFGNALSFDGAAARVDIDAGLVTPNWTVSLWVQRKADATFPATTLMDCLAAVNGTSLRLEQVTPADNVGITEYTVIDYGFGYVAPLNEWVHLVFSSDGANARLHVNGTLVDTAPRAYNLHVDKLGTASTTRTNSIDGFLDEVQVYDRLLTGPEITGLSTFLGGIRSATNDLLDGEFSGTLPSGDGAFGGDFVATFTVSSPPPPIAAPTGLLAVSVSPAQIDLSWTDHANNEDGYEVERSLDGVSFSLIATLGPNAQTYSDTGLAAMTLYYYRVRAFNAATNSSYSNTTSTTTHPATPGPPLKITAVSVTPGTSLTSPPGQIIVSLSQTVDPVTVTPRNVTLVGAGVDGMFGTGDDVTVTPAGVSLQGGNQIVIDLTGVSLTADDYELRLVGTETAIPDLLNHWRLDEGAGTTAADTSGSGDHGQLSGPTWSAGRIGNGLLFGGTTDRVLIGATDVAAPWTASLWVQRVDSLAADSRILDSEMFPVGGSLRLEQFNNTNQVGFTAYGVADHAFAYSAPPGNWVHISFVCDGVATDLWVDGVLVDQIAATIALPRFYMGSHGSNSMAGILDDLRVYGRALSSLELGDLAILGGGIRSDTGGLLDGEFGGTFPSGDDTAGGEFVLPFSIALPTKDIVVGCGFSGGESFLLLGLLLLVRRWKRGCR